MNNYQKSNSIVSLSFQVSPQARRLTYLLLDVNSVSKRQKISDALLDELADLAQIDICRLQIVDAKQYHKKRGGRVAMKRYGYYQPADKFINISNRTAVRGQILAPKTFLNTLLHEWMHHYDFCKLKIDSIHSKGFYTRLKLLQDDLTRHSTLSST